MTAPRILTIFALALALAFTAGAANAESVAQFYKGKKVIIYIGTPPGGGYDAYARTLARHIGRFIPGNPSVTPKNVPAASGLVLANNLYNRLPKDGTAIGVWPRGQITEPLFGNKHARFHGGLNFAGNIEGHEVFEGNIQVVVSDGFAGNIVVKVAEGLAEAFLGMVDAHIGKTDLIADERWLKVKKAFRAEADWRESGGAALIGVYGVVMIGHGRCDERAVASALRRTTSLCEKKINDQIVEALRALNDRLATLDK